MSEDRLADTVAVVTGASRGVGRGVAEELGRRGATVYVTGRTESPEAAPAVEGTLLAGTVHDTAEAVTKLGGTGIAVVCDSADDAQLGALFDRVGAEHGRLDLLVNNAYTVPGELARPQPFWERPVSVWDDVFDVGVRSAYVASRRAARMMTSQGSGLIVQISAPWAKVYRYTPAYGVGKVAVDRLASDIAYELAPHGVASLALWLGAIRTERALAGAADALDPATTESPGFVGRAVSALTADPNVLTRTGRSWYVTDLADAYGFTDVGGVLPTGRRERYGEPTLFVPGPLPQASGAGEGQQ